MKNVIVALLSIIALFSCQKSNQEKAEKLIEAGLKNAPGVESIEFGTLGKAQLDYELTLPAYRLREEMRQNIEIAQEKQKFIDQWKDIYPAGLENDIKEVQKRAEYIKLLNDSFELEKNRFQPDTTRYMMEVKIRHLNPKTNQVESEHGIFYFDKDISRVVGAMGPINDNNKIPVYIEYDKNTFLKP